MTDHKHHACQHQLAYCQRCDVAYCALCGREWGGGANWTYTIGPNTTGTPPNFTTTWTNQTWNTHTNC